MTAALHNPNWPNYQGWPLIINHIWAAVIANDRLSFKGWCPDSEQEYYGSDTDHSDRITVWK